jgi:hypothetical protein
MLTNSDQYFVDRSNLCLLFRHERPPNTARAHDEIHLVW